MNLVINDESQHGLDPHALEPQQAGTLEDFKIKHENEAKAIAKDAILFPSTSHTFHLQAESAVP